MTVNLDQQALGAALMGSASPSPMGLGPALTTKLPMQMAQSGGGVMTNTVGSAEAAQQLLQQLQQEGRTGYITPYGPNGVYGYDVKHWPLNNGAK